MKGGRSGSEETFVMVQGRKEAGRQGAGEK